MNQNFAIHHVSMVIANIKKSLGFYCNVLGLEQNQERPKMSIDGAWLNAGKLQIHLLLCANPDPVTGRPKHAGHDRHLALSCNNLEQIKQSLQLNKIDFSESKSGRKALFCRDPDGNTIELIQA